MQPMRYFIINMSPKACKYIVKIALLLLPYYVFTSVLIILRYLTLDYCYSFWLDSCDG